MKLLKHNLAIITLGIIAIPAIADTTSDDEGVAVCERVYQNQLKFTDNARAMAASFSQYATTAEEKKEIEQQIQQFDDLLTKLKSPEGQKEEQQKCLEQYKKDPVSVNCVANATDMWGTLDCMPSE